MSLTVNVSEFCQIKASTIKDLELRNNYVKELGDKMVCGNNVNSRYSQFNTPIMH